MGKRARLEREQFDRRFQRAAINVIAPVVVPAGFLFNTWSQGEEEFGVLFEAPGAYSARLPWAEPGDTYDSPCSDLWIIYKRAADELEAHLEGEDIEAWLRARVGSELSAALQQGEIEDRLRALGGGLVVLMAALSPAR